MDTLASKVDKEALVLTSEIQTTTKGNYTTVKSNSSGVAKVEKSQPQAKPIMSSAQPILVSTAQSMYIFLIFHIKYIIYVATL